MFREWQAAAANKRQRQPYNSGILEPEMDDADDADDSLVDESSLSVEDTYYNQLRFVPGNLHTVIPGQADAYERQSQHICAQVLCFVFLTLIAKMVAWTTKRTFTFIDTWFL